MARISTYNQDTTLSVNDKFLGTDSTTGGTKNFTIQSIVDLINSKGLVAKPLSVSYNFGSYDEDATEPKGIIALGTANPTPGLYSSVTEIIVSKEEEGGLDVEAFLKSLVGYNIRISTRDNNKTNYGVYTVSSVVDIDDNNDNFLRMSLSHQNSQGSVSLVGEFYITVNPSEPSQADWTATSGKNKILNKPNNFIFETSSVADLSDVYAAGSGYIITENERTKLTTGVVETTRTIQVQGTTDQVSVSPDTAQDLTANRSFTVGLPDNVTISDSLTATNKINVGGPIEVTATESTTPTFDNGFYFNEEDGHDTLHFRYHGHDLSIDHLTENIPSGILNGGVLSKANSTQFTIAAGNGVINILNKSASDPHPEIKQLSWAQQTITVSNLNASDTSQLNSWIYVDSTGSVQQQSTPFTDAQKRSNITIGSAIHSEGVLKFVKTFPLTGYNNISQISEFVQTFGPMKKSGHVVSANGTNLSINRAAGVAFALGRNYAVDPLNPSTVSDPAKTTCVIHRYYSDGSNGFVLDDGPSGNGYTTLDVGKYDDGSGTLANVPGGNFTTQRLYFFPSTPDIVIAYYGKNKYNSLQEAENNYLKESFLEAGNTSEQAIYLGVVIVKGNVTELNNTSEAKFLTAGTFRSLASVSVGGTIASEVLNDLTDVNITGVANDQVLKYNSVNAQWENVEDSVDPLSLDSINGRVGLNVPSPAATFDVKTTETAASAKILNFKSNTDVSRLVLQNDGKVGIGATSPRYTLHSKADGNHKALMLQGGGSANQYAELGFIASVGDGTDANLYIRGHRGSDGTFAGSYLTVGTNNTERMRIDSGGNVNVNENLTVESDILVTGNIRNTGSGDDYIDINNGEMSFYTDGKRMQWLNTGSLRIFETDSTTRLAAEISASATKGTFSLYDNTFRTVLFDAGGNSYFNGGNLGIGTTSPEDSLHIDGGNIQVSTENAGEKAFVFLEESNGGTGSTFGYDGGDNTLFIGTTANNNTTISKHIVIPRSTGNVGIGETSPDTQLHIKGAANAATRIKLELNDSGSSINPGQEYGGIEWSGNDAQGDGVRADIRVFGEGTSGETYMTFGTKVSGFTGSTSASERMRIDSDGNVGIGTQTVDDKLHILGDSAKIQQQGQTGITLKFNHGNNTSINSDINIANIKSFVSSGSTGSEGGGLTFETKPTAGAATERMRINSSGRVGIGETSPSKRLHIKGANDTDAALQITRTDQSSELVLGFNYVGTFSNTNMLLFSNSTQRIAITNNGAIEIKGQGTGNTFIGDGNAGNLGISTGTYNTALGNDALGASTTGSSNIALGYRTGAAITTGAQNVSIGRDNLQTITTTSNNISIGHQAMQLATGSSASGNIAIGTQTGRNLRGANNVAVGYRAMLYSTTAQQSVAVGSNALKNLTSGNANTAVGFQSQYYATTGLENVSMGYNSLLYNATGDRNTAIGHNSMAGASGNSPNHNTAVGWKTMYDITTGSHNVALGMAALESITTGQTNIAVGNYALTNETTGSNNVAMGHNALNAATTAGGNIAIGAYAMDAVTTQGSQVAIGSYSMGATTTGYGNTAIGHNTMAFNTTGHSNVAIGYQALDANTTGHTSVAIGHSALTNATTPYGNTAIGYQALSKTNTGIYNTAVGQGALLNSTTGERNAAFGWYAGSENTTGIKSTFLGMYSGRFLNDGTTLLTNATTSLYIGYDTRSGHSTSSVTNEIVIGAGGRGNGSNTATYGSTNITKHVFPSGHVQAKQGVQSISTTSGTINLDASTYGIFNFSSDLTAATTLNLQNMKEGQVVEITGLSGSYTVTLDAHGSSSNTFNKLGDDYDGTADNYLQISCVNDDSANPVFFYSVATYTSDSTI